MILSIATPRHRTALCRARRAGAMSATNTVPGSMVSESKPAPRVFSP
ncbi:MAG: hypothetical protein IKH04_04855 [Kiritimatiellae bacterium]|nr:hypothetical protein [Kiritimatiellia bacterium]